MDKKNTLITVLSGILACALIAILLLGLYIGGVFGKKNKTGDVAANPSAEGKTLEVKEGMTLDEFRAYILYEHVNGLTMTTTQYDENGDTIETETIYATNDGSLDVKYDKDGNVTSYWFRLIEDGRAYEKRFNWTDKNPSDLFRVVDLEGAEVGRVGGAFASSARETLNFALLLVSMGFGTKVDGGEYFADYKFEAKEDEVMVDIPNQKQRIVANKFNKTTIPVLDEFKDYKTDCAEEDVEKLGNYEKRSDADGEYYEFTGLNNIFYRNTSTLDFEILPDVDVYEVKSEINNVPVKAISTSDTIRKNIIIPTSVTKIDRDFLDEGGLITYKGTLEQWKKIEISEYTLNNVKQEIRVVCSDGETVISPKKADA